MKIIYWIYVDFVAAGEQAKLQIVTPQIGETMNLNHMENSMECWWKDIL